MHVRRNDVESSAAAGVADFHARTPLTPHLRFPIGSITKTFVATVVLQLVDEGRLGLEDRVERWLGDGVPAAVGISIRQLLNHTSGLSDYLQEPSVLQRYREQLNREWTPRELLAEGGIRALDDPGAGWRYSNTNYVLLGLVIEAAARRTLGSEIEARVASPLGLVKTEMPQNVRPEVRGYLPCDNPLLPAPGEPVVDVTATSPSFGWAAGGMVSTAGEVTAFLRALLAGELLEAQSLAAMLATVAADGVECDAYGLGIAEITSLGGSTSSCGSGWGHQSFAPGYTSVAISSVDGRRQVVAMVNCLGFGEETWVALGDAVWWAYCG